MFVTSDHIFIDPAKKGKFRGNAARCRVEFFFSGRRYSIEPDSLVHGLKANKTAYLFPWYDWAIGQLDRPVPDVQPFALSPVAPGIGLAVSVISAGMNDATPRVCTGEITSAWGQLQRERHHDDLYGRPRCVRGAGGCRSDRSNGEATVAGAGPHHGLQAGRCRPQQSHGPAPVGSGNPESAGWVAWQARAIKPAQ